MSFKNLCTISLCQTKNQPAILGVAWKVWHLKEEKFHMVKLCDICQLKFFEGQKCRFVFSESFNKLISFSLKSSFPLKENKRKNICSVVTFSKGNYSTFQSRFWIWISLSLHSFWEEEVKCIYFKIIATEKRCFK